MSNHIYSNSSGTDIIIVGVGEVEAGGTIETDQVIENPNLVEVEQETKVAKKTVNKDDE